MKPNHVILWKFRVQRVKLLTVWVHITHRIDCGLRMVADCAIAAWVSWDFNVNCSKVFVCFHLCTCIPHFRNSCWTL